MEIYPYSLYIRMIPDAGTLSGPDVGKCTVRSLIVVGSQLLQTLTGWAQQSTCVHMLRWEIPSTLPPCFAPIPPSISAVLSFNNCIAVNNYIQCKRARCRILRFVFTNGPL